MALLFLALGAVAFAVSGAEIAVASDGPREVSYQDLDGSETDAEVFLTVNASNHEIAAVRRAILSTSTIKRYAFVDKRTAYKEFKRIFRDRPDLVRRTRASDLPVSFRVDFARGVQFAAWSARIQTIHGVDVVTVPHASTNLGGSSEEILRACAEQDFTFVLYLKVDATPEQMAGVRATLEHEPAVTELVSAGDTGPSFRMKIALDERTRVLSLLRSLPGVDGIANPDRDGCARFGLSPAGSG
jgi:hypothetical protein